MSRDKQGEGKMTSALGKMVLLLGVSASTLAATPAFAQTAATPEAERGKLEDVVVTARKQTERLQDVPVTVTALTSTAVEKLQIKSIFDLAQVTPGVYYGTTGGRNGGNKLQIRNFSTGTAGPSKASVFIDGVYQPGDYSGIPLANLDRVEVLKGPQSAYFGRATFVGAVNFVTRDPGNVFSGNLDLVHASLNEHDYTGYISAPIIQDVLSTQITFRDYSFEGRDRWRTVDGYQLGSQSTKAISSKTVWTPTSDLKLKLYYAHTENDDAIPPTLYADLRNRVAIARPGGTFGYYYNGVAPIDFSTASWGLSSASFTRPGIRYNRDQFALNYDWTVLGGHTISGFVATGKEKYDEQLDGTLYLSGTSPTVIPNAVGTPTTATFATSALNFYLKEKDEQFEVRIASPQDQPFRYLLGYGYSKIEGGNRLDTLAGATIFYQSSYGGSFLNPATDNSVFGGLFWDVTDKLTVSAEARYQKEEILAETYSTAAATFGTTLTSVTAKYDAFLPRFNVQYKITPDVQVYAIYSEGNNPGGFQPITPAQAASIGAAYAYDEESIKNYEAGFKSTLFDGRLILNAAAFRMNFTKEQLSQTTPVPGTPTGFASIFLPGVEAKVTGFEVEANAAVTSNFQVRGTVGYGKAEYVNFCSVPYAALTGIQTGLNCRSVNGKQQEGTPALQTSLSGDYTQPLTGDLSAYLRGDWQYQSKVYNDEWNQSWIPAFSTVNARVGIENGTWTLEGFVRNLTDDDHSQRSTRVTDSRAGAVTGSYPTLGGFSQGIAGQQNVAETAKKSRQYGVRVGYKW